MPPTYSILIPVYNHGKYLDKAILSALRSEYVGEVLLVDDGSPDGSPEIIRNFERNNPDRVRVLPNPDFSNLGAPARLNQLVKAASYDWLAVLNSDDEFVAGRFEAVASLAQQSDAEFYFGSLSIIDKDGLTVRSKRALFSPEYALPHELELASVDEEGLLVALANQNYVATTSNMIFSKNLYTRIGGFADYRYCHDWDFALRASLLGRVRYIPQHITKYRLHDSNTIKDDWRKVHEEVRTMFDRIVSDFPDLTHHDRYKLALAGNPYLHSGPASESMATRETTEEIPQPMNSQTANQFTRTKYSSSCQAHERQDGWRFHTAPEILLQLIKDASSHLEHALQDVRLRMFEYHRLSAIERDAFDLIEQSGVFDRDYYCQKYRVVTLGAHPLIHFIKVGSLLDRNPNSWLDVPFYRNSYPDVRGTGLDLVIHYIRVGTGQLRKPNELWVEGQPVTECLGSSANLSDIVRAQLILANGRLRERQVSHGSRESTDEFRYLEIEEEVNNLRNRGLPTYWQKYLAHLGASAAFNYLVPRTRVSENKSIVLFFGHQASRTGAPMVLLELVQKFANDGYECVTILKESGPLVREFAKHSHVIDLANCPAPETVVELYSSSLTAVPKPYSFLGTIVNSIECQPITTPLSDIQKPVIYLVHELSDGYAHSYLQSVSDLSTKLVFSSYFAFSQFEDKVPVEPSKVLLLPQGLLDPSFGLCSRKEARYRFRDELQLPETAFLVIGCGFLHLRKGCDLFVDVARMVLKRGLSDLHFVWIGGGENSPFSLHYYLHWDLKQHSIANNVHFIGERADLSDYFVGADLFLMPSRQDPFPCVAQLAMAASLPVIAFEGAGGVPEMLQHGGGDVVPYGDASAMAELVLSYAGNREKVVSVGKCGRAVIADHYSFDRYFRTLEQLLVARSQNSGDDLSQRAASAPALIPPADSGSLPIVSGRGNMSVSAVSNSPNFQSESNFDHSN